jgi:hypothetical protein
MNREPKSSRLISHLATAMTATLSLATLVFGVISMLAGAAGSIVIAPSAAGDTKLAGTRLEWGKDAALVGAACVLVCIAVWSVARRFPIGIPIASLITGAACTWLIAKIEIMQPPTLPVTAGVWTIAAVGLGILALVTDRRHQLPDKRD